MLDLYRRLRHSFGFGVHSPFAFRFVRDVVRAPRGAWYYSHRELRWMLRRLPRRERRRCLLLFRLAARIGFSHVCISPRTPRIVEDALHAALTGAGFRVMTPCYSRPGTLAVCLAEELPADFTAATRTPGCVLVLTEVERAREKAEAAISTMSGGWTFEGRRMAILVSDPAQPLCRLNLALP